MTSERWQRVSELYEQALERSPEARDIFLSEVCAGDPVLRADVDSLLAQDDHASPLDAPVWMPEELKAEHRELPAGTQVGPYRVERVLGAGGMGEVYRARDSKLGRSVALKVLPARFVRDAERLARFAREAQLLAALNHPNIGTIHGIEESSSSGSPQPWMRALVLELVEGETLAERIARGPIPLDEALPIAIQIADALEAAHDRGVIHRDLKPANIKVRPDGVVKVLDFGLARLVETDGVVTHSDAAFSPTVTSPAIVAGATVILGTAAYMAPEQAKGRPADQRSDIWAFGSVLYEMLTGRRAFPGADVSDTLAAVLRSEPDWNVLPPGTPAAVRRLLGRALAKNPRDRLRDIADARLELREPLDVPRREPGSDLARSGRRGYVPWIAGAAGLVSVLASSLFFARPSQPAREVRVDIVTPPTSNPMSLALSPDGQQIVFVAGADGQEPQLWLRALNDSVARPLDGTSGALNPFWSPDSRAIAFTADRSLKRIDLDTRVVRSLAGAQVGGGGSWSPRGVIVYSAATTQGLRRVAAIGGTPVPVTRLNAPQEVGHAHPQFLSDGRRFLYTVRGDAAVGGTYVADLDGHTPQRLLPGAVAARVAGEHLLFVRGASLFGQRFDQTALSLRGEPFEIADGVLVDEGYASAALTADGGRSIAYRGGAVGQRQLVWFDRAGTELARLEHSDALVTADSRDLELSPDGRFVAMARTDNGNRDVWVLDLSRGISTRMISDVGVESQPVWSPDGRQIAYASSRKGVPDLYVRPAAIGEGDALLLATPFPKGLADWSRDGRFLLFGTGAATRRDGGLWVLPLVGDRTPFRLLASNVDERLGQFSPDGKWVAFEAAQSGRSEIFVVPFRRPGNPIRISPDGGGQVRWRRDGKELFYIRLDGQLMAAPIRVTPRGDMDPGAPLPLFATRLTRAVPQAGGARHQYIVSPDGQRFLIDTLIAPAETHPITLILNWNPPD